MRIIAGSLKGREFKSPRGAKTHPMADKVRGALFNVLGDVKGLTFLDAFAGSGALAFEALSRGAASAIAIDNDRSAFRVMSESAKSLSLENIKVIHASASVWSENNQDMHFDIVLLAPPYDNLQLNLLEKLADRHVEPAGLIVLDWPGKSDAPGFEGFSIAEQKKYGDAQLVFYRRKL